MTGLQDPAMCEIVAQSSADCVVMHHISIPASRDHIVPRHLDIVTTIYDWAANHFDELERRGISRERIIFDPGIGFGKAPEQSFELIKHIAQFKKLGTRILVGHSRKSFLTSFTHYPAAERDVETMAISLFLADQPVDYLRIHNVEMCARALKIWRAFISPSLQQRCEMSQK
ncbi:MAG: Folate synthesis bifunctional protein [uncultured bacterium]|nr:MAG: Folate synthesis bifunctional protein [uncultured bacterium]